MRRTSTCSSMKCQICQRYATKTITIGFLLEGFTNSDAKLDSEVGTWLTNVKSEAEAQLKKDLEMDVILEISDSKVPRYELLRRIRTWSTGGQMHADTVVDYMKRYFANSYNPDILCLVTKDTLYGDNGLNDEPGYSKHKDLCTDMVPIIMQYNLMDPQKSGNLLFSLIKRSFPSNWDSLNKDQREQLLDSCNKQYKASYADYDDYYVLPLYKDYVEK
uniref:Putative ixodes 26 kDa salivary protein n=1 Tax=Ixodes ricinus TaxID=34613 RepID=A0A0K8RG66_IXORI